MTKTEEFINRSRLVHKDKYDYSLVEYIKSSEKVISIWEKDYKLINKIKYRYNV